MKTMVWPVYINSQRSRKEGRRLNLEDSIEDPKIREITQALRKLKLQYVSENNKSFPSSWWEKSGRVVVEHEFDSKLDLLKKISSTIKSARKD